MSTASKLDELSVLVECGHVHVIDATFITRMKEKPREDWTVAEVSAIHQLYKTLIGD